MNEKDIYRGAPGVSHQSLKTPAENTDDRAALHHNMRSSPEAIHGLIDTQQTPQLCRL